MKGKLLGFGTIGGAGLAIGLVLFSGGAASESQWILAPDEAELASLSSASQSPGETVFIKQLPDGSRIPVTATELDRIAEMRTMMSGDPSFDLSVERFADIENAPTLSITQENLLTLVPQADATSDASGVSVFLSPLDATGLVPFCEAFTDVTSEMDTGDVPDDLRSVEMGVLLHGPGGGTDRIVACAVVEASDPYGVVAISNGESDADDLKEVLANVDIAS